MCVSREPLRHKGELPRLSGWSAVCRYVGGRFVVRPWLPVLLFALAAIAVPNTSRADDANDQYAVAAGHYAEQRWKFAAEEFQAFLEKYPNHPRANQSLFLLGEALLQTGDKAKAAKYFQEYLERDPKGKFARPALYRAGETAYMTKDNKRARHQLELFRQRYSDDPLSAYVLPYLGDLALARDDPTAAIKYFQEALQRFPDGPLLDDCEFGLARAFERLGKNDEAERYYGTVAQKTTSRWADDAHFHLGSLQYAMGKYAQAVATFTDFEKQRPQSPWIPSARLGHGWALMKLGRLDEAKPIFRSVVDDPKIGVDAQYWLGMAQKLGGDYPAAAKTLAAAAVAGPKHSSVSAMRYHAGDALLRAGNPKAAIAELDRMITAAEPDDTWFDDALLAKVQAALELADHDTLDRAAEEFRRRCSGSPLTANLDRAVAQSLLARQKYDAAAKLLEPLVQVGLHDQRGLEDRYLLARAYEGLKRYDDALALLLPVTDSAKGELRNDALLSQGVVLRAMKRYDAAVEPLNTLLKDKPKGELAVKALSELAICYALGGELDKAKAIYRHLAEKFPGNELLGPLTEHLAEAAYAAKDTQWAAELFEYLKSDTQSKENRWKGFSGLGWSQFKAKKFDEAAATFEQLLATDPPDDLAAEAAWVRGQILDQKGQHDQALVMYDRVIDKYPTSTQHPQALLAAARLRDRLEQDREAAALYQQLAEKYPKFDKLDAVLYEWAWVLDELNKPQEAVQQFQRIRQEFPKSRYFGDATIQLAERDFAAKQYNQAEKLIDDILAPKDDAQKDDPRSRENALWLQGRIAIAREKWAAVQDTFGKLLSKFPETERRLVVEYWIAEAVFNQNDFEAAERRFAKLLQDTQGQKEPWLANIALRQAQALAHLKRWNQAYALAKQIEHDFPDFELQFEVDYLLGRCLANRADFQAARDAYQRVIRSPGGAKTETAAMAQWMIGESYMHQKNFEAAVREFLKLKILYAYPTWQAAALLQAGKCHEKLGEWQQASKLYAQLLHDYPKTPFAEEASRILKQPPEQRAAAREFSVDPN